MRIGASGANQSWASQHRSNFCEEVNSRVSEHVEVSYRTSSHNILNAMPNLQKLSERSCRRRFATTDIVGPFSLKCQAFRLQRPSVIHMTQTCDPIKGWIFREQGGGTCIPMREVIALESTGTLSHIGKSQSRCGDWKQDKPLSQIRGKWEFRRTQVDQ